jgi:hypothetical protein
VSDQFDHLEDSEREWLRADRRSAARRSLLLIGALVTIAAFLAWLTVSGLPSQSPGKPSPTPKVPGPPLPRPVWWVFTAGWMVMAVVVAAAAVRVAVPRLRRRLETVQDDLKAAERQRDEWLRESVLPFLRGALSQSSYRMDLNEVEAPGLSEVFDRLNEVRVSATIRLQRLIDQLPGGSIGIAGPRGAGKTTLIRAFCRGSRSHRDDISTLQSAPVEYSPRDFVLYLFVSLCYEVLGQTEDEQLAEGMYPGEPVGPRFRSARQLLVVGGLLLLIGGALLLWLFAQDIHIDPRLAWGLAMLLSGGLVLYVARPLLFVRPSFAVADEDDQRALLRSAALRRLKELRFQQTISSTWTGGAKAPVGLEATVSRGSTLARVQLSFPELVTKLRRFLELVARNSDGRVIIGIDELDKLPSDELARQFINEIKAIFGVRGCYYLVSISEEAMASFDSRGMPFRDVFDSSFDDVVHVSYLGLPDVERLLNRRVVLPKPFTCLCYCLSGGLARDLIRTARNLVEAQPQPAEEDSAKEDLGGNDVSPFGGRRRSRPKTSARRQSLPIGPAAKRLVGEEVRRKTAAAVASLHAIDLEPETSEVVKWASSIDEWDAASWESLLAKCRWCADNATLRPGANSDSEELLAARQTLFRLTRELCGYYYYAATILQFFNDQLTEQQVREAIGPAAGHRSIDLLATSRQAFAINPRLAWESLSRFRKAWDLEGVVHFPERLLWARGKPTTSR